MMTDPVRMIEWSDHGHTLLSTLMMITMLMHHHIVLILMRHLVVIRAHHVIGCAAMSTHHNTVHPRARIHTMAPHAARARHKLRQSITRPSVFNIHIMIELQARQ